MRAFEINLEGKPMKKVLFATTALIATAGMASADISMGGFGRFGIVHADGAANETYLTQRMRLTVTGTTESDAGVKFEGRMRVESNEDGRRRRCGRKRRLALAQRALL